MRPTDVLNRILSDNPQLVQVKPQLWRSNRTAEVSYPEDGHASMARIEETFFWFNHRNRLIVSLVRRFAPEFMVDVGAGNGFVTRGILEAGTPVIVVEPGIAGADLAAERGLPVINAALDQIRLRESSLAAAGFFDVLEHLATPEAVLTTVRTAMAKDAMLFITVPAYGWLWSEEDDLAGHYRRYGRRSICELVERCGFKVEYSTYMFSFLVAPILAARTLRGITGVLRRGTKEDVSATHRHPQGVAGRLLSRSMRWEQERVDRRRSIPFGSSCLIVARAG